VTAGGLVLALFALVLAAIYQDDSPVEDVNVVGAETTLSVDPADPGQSTTDTGPTDPIEGFLPRGGEASACLEPVGVDLAPGYAATLTINGIVIADSEMNVELDEDGEPTGDITASRSLGQYTFGPEENCPNARVLRPTNNLLQACVYLVTEGPETCDIAEMTFDVL
jgi:hypothetical protein